MTATFEIPLASETLASDEIEAITGAAQAAHQIKWLTDNGWLHHITRAGKPVIGRMYARLKMAGVNMAPAQAGWQPDLRAVR